MYVMYNTTRKNKSKKNITRKTQIQTPMLEKLHKCSRSRIIGMETYKINCGKNLLLGYHTIKSAEETSLRENEFVHVVLAKLQDYDGPVVVKVYDQTNIHLPIEMRILKKITGYRNTPQLICNFSCNDDKNRYLTKIKNRMQFCNNGTNRLHFFVYEYISYGDVSDFLMKHSETKVIKSLLLQIACIIIQLATIYGMYHGDINSGNLLVDKTTDDFIDYCIEGEQQSITIESYGVIPKIIDFGRSNFYKDTIPINDVWFDVMMAFSVLYPYIQDIELKEELYHLVSDEIIIEKDENYESLLRKLPFW